MTVASRRLLSQHPSPRARELASPCAAADVESRAFRWRSRLRAEGLRLAVVAIVLVVALPAWASDPLDQPLGGLAWGASPDAVIAQQEEILLEEYRLSIAGENDPLVIDRQRRLADDVVGAIRQSYQEFPDQRTGYEVSVMGGEIAGARGQSMLIVRGESDTRYYVFEGEALRKIVVTFDQSALGYISFEPFVNRLSSVLGDVHEFEWRTDDIGVRHLERAHWAGERTLVRAEDKTRMFASYVLVYSDAAWVAPEVVVETSVANTEGRRAIGDVMSRIQSQRDEAEASNENVVDELLGGAVEVELQVREDPDALAAESEEEEAEAAPEPTRPRPARTAPETAPEPEPESETVF